MGIKLLMENNFIVKPQHNVKIQEKAVYVKKQIENHYSEDLYDGFITVDESGNIATITFKIRI